MAAALTSEANWFGRYFGPVAYTTAGCIGLARLYQNVHWASDLPLGAAIGTWSGLTVVARAHAREENRIEQAIGATTILAASPSDVVVGWHVPFGS
jgi:membrane-associated phospholipid phosphatase